MHGCDSCSCTHHSRKLQFESLQEGLKIIHVCSEAVYVVTNLVAYIVQPHRLGAEE